MSDDDKFLNEKHKELYDKYKFLQIDPITIISIVFFILVVIYTIIVGIYTISVCLGAY